MRHTLRYTLFGIGKLPDELRDELAEEQVLFEYEGIPVTRHFSGSLPGKSADGETTSYSGALVATRTRVVGFGRTGATSLDVHWDDAGEGGARLTFSEQGAKLELDLPRIHAGWEGRLELEFQQELTADELARLPTRSLSYSIDPHVARWIATRVLEEEELMEGEHVVRGPEVGSHRGQNKHHVFSPVQTKGKYTLTNRRLIYVRSEERFEVPLSEVRDVRTEERFKGGQLVVIVTLDGAVEHALIVAEPHEWETQLRQGMTPAPH